MYTQYYSTNRKTKIMQFVPIWINLKSIILNGVSQKVQKDLFHMWDIKKLINA